MRPRNPHSAPALAGLLILLACLSARPARAEQPADTADPGEAARWIDRVNRALLPGEAMRARANLYTRDGYGGESREVFDMVRADVRGAVRTLIEVEAPEAGKGVVYQIVARPHEPLHSWVWLPEVRRIRHIEGVRRTDPFLGSEFSYEDLGLAFPEERRAGSARWTELEGRRLVELESPAYHYYSRVVTRIDPATNLPVQVEFFDLAGQLFREQRYGGLREIDGHLFPTTIEVRDRLTGAYSVLDFDSVHFDVEVPEMLFSHSIVRRHLAGNLELVPEPE